MGQFLRRTSGLLPTPARAFLQGFALLGLAIAPAKAWGADEPRTPWHLLEIVSAVPAFKPISEVQVDVRLRGGRLPDDRSETLFAAATPVSDEALERSAWPELDVWWAPTEFFHQPLYFDDVLLESYGQSRCRILQPGLSGIHFFANLALVPCKLVADHPYSRISQLGEYRPGSCAPPQRERLRWQIDPQWLHPGVCVETCRH